MKSFIPGVSLLLLFPLFSLGQLPVGLPKTVSNHFEQNKKQWNENVQFRAELSSGYFFLEKNAFTYLFYNSDDVQELNHNHSKNATHDEDPDAKKIVHLHAFKTEFINANSSPVLTPSGPSAFYRNYFIGNDPSKWASEVKLFEQVHYDDLYKGVDMRVYSNEAALKYDLIVAPGTNPAIIKMRYSGTDKLYLENGNLYIVTSLGNVMEQKPFVYQEVNRSKKEVDCHFTLHNNVLGFIFPYGYDKTKELIIDPVLIVSTYTGSTADNWGTTATYDAAGNIFTGGIAAAFGYPTSVGAFQTTFGGGGPGGGGYPFDMVVSKFNPVGNALIASTYIGGIDNEAPHSIVVSPTGELFIYGRTFSNNYPTTPGSFDVTFNGGGDMVVARLNPTFTTLLASTYVGGTLDDGVNISANFFTQSSLKHNYGDDARGEIILDAAGNVYVASCTQSNNFPTTPGAYQTVFGGSQQDGCVFKMPPALNTMTWSTFLGGSGNDACYALGFDAANNVYATGGTTSANFPSTPGVIHPAYMGGLADGFITKISNTGATVINSTFIGTAAYDQSYFIQVDNSFDVYIYGQTSGAYPVTPGVYSNANSSQFIHKLNPVLSTTIYSTVFGTGTSVPNISPTAFLVDTCENVYCSGWGRCLGFGSNPGTTFGLPITGNAQQPTTDGCDFYFFVLTTNAQTLWYATYFGANGIDDHVDGGTSRFDRRGVIYQSVCAGCGGSNAFPTTVGAWSQTNNSFNCNNAIIKFDFQLANITAQASAAPSDTICVGQTVNFNNTSQNSTNYIWDFGDGSPLDTNTAPSHTYTNTGSYTVILVAIDSSSCTFSDTTFLTITVIPFPTVFLGNDTTLCGTPNITLNAGNPGMTYQWSTGSTGQTINVNLAGMYWVIVDNGYCTAIDTILINTLSNPSLGIDTTVCSGQNVTLNANNTGANFLWSTGATTQSISVNTTGTYWVVASVGICSQTDTIVVTVTPLPVVSINDSTVCQGDNVLLDAGNSGSTYQWSTGATTQTININSAGQFWVIVTSSGCTSSDTMTLSLSSVVNLGPDIDLCELTVTTLDAGNAGATYQWSTGETTQTIQVAETGNYWVIVSAGSCTILDTIVFTGGFGGGTVYFPNSFTPNGDPLNETFGGVGEDLISYYLRIFNRWGELIFESDNLLNKWDGKQNGDVVQEDVYVWICNFETRCTNGKIKKIGHVSVIR